ncbi:MAG: hypothetical protein LBN32_04825 [Helicobacteraceae bacterium]|nr:hypothetical protein [Helicobacteraceae bacterium]
MQRNDQPQPILRFAIKQTLLYLLPFSPKWILAFAGMTEMGGDDRLLLIGCER